MRSIPVPRLFAYSLLSFGLLLSLSGCPSTPPTDLCDGVVCDDPPAAICDGDVVVSYAEQGTCDAGECEYEETRTACPADHICVDAECVPAHGPSPCDDVVCSDPPGDHCEDGVLMHDPTGHCEEDGDDAVCVYVFAETDCEAQQEVCLVQDAGAECVDLCEDVDCPAREDGCENGSAYTYGGAAGSCDFLTGDCEYPADDETVTPCEGETICWVDTSGTASCVPDPASQLCSHPCGSDAECGRDIDLCALLEPAEGSYCLTACGDVGDCEEGYSCSVITSVDGLETSACVPDEGYCTEPSCYVGSACAHPVCEGHLACNPGYNFDFENWVASDPPAGFDKSLESDFEITEESGIVNTGSRAAKVETTAGTSNRDLRVHRSNLLPADSGVTYTLHQWNRFDGPNGWYRAGLTFLDANGDRIGDRIFGDLTDVHESWLESTLLVTAPPMMPPMLEVNMKPFLRVRHLGANDPDEPSPSVAYTDDWAVTVPYSFTVDPDTPDQAATIVSGGRTYIMAAINNAGVLYVSTNLQGHTDGHDRILFVWIGGVGRGMVPYPMSKDGSVAGPADAGTLLALTQNETTSRCEWLIFDQSSINPANPWVLLPGGVDCPMSPGHHLTGTLNLAGLLEVDASEVPAQIILAAGAFSNDNGSSLVGQVPPSGDGDGDIDPEEIEAVHRASILAGKIHR